MLSSKCQIQRLTSGFAAKLFCLLAVLTFNTSVHAQDVPEAHVVDSNGANLLTGSLEGSIPLVSIGYGTGALSHSFNIVGFGGFYSSSGSSISIAYQPADGEYDYNVILPGGTRIRFTADVSPPMNSTVFYEYIDRGNSLKFENGSYVFTSRDGTVASYAPYGASKARATSITSPDGTTLTYDYIGSSLSSIRNNLGYQLKYQDPQNLSEVRAINNALLYCNPTVVSCSVPSYWAKGLGNATPAPGGSQITNGFTDAANRSYQVQQQNFPNTTVQILGLPNGEAYHVGIYTSGQLTTSVINGIAHDYSSSIDDKGTSTEDDDERTMTVTYPDGGTRTVVSKIKGSLVLSDTDALGNTTSYSYTNDNLISAITYTRGNSVHYSYDDRGNVIEVRRKSVPGYGARVDIVTTAAFLASCSASTQKYCNKPIWTRDARGKQTDYTYHAQSGDILSVTRPAASAGQTRPKTEFTYVQYRAKVKNSAGALVDSSPVWKVQQVKNLANTSRETTTNFTYNANLNLTPATTTISAAGVASRTTTTIYDNYGNLKHSRSKTGAESWTTTLYDKLRRPTFSIGIDPDGNGSRPRPATRTTYNDLGDVVKTESGTIPTYTSGMNGFSSLQSSNNVYDDYGRKLMSYAKTGSTIHALQEYSYDNRRRVVCSATRMNPSQFSTIPGDACTLGGEGLFGPDRINKNIYDVGSRVTESISAYGTSEQVSQYTTYWSYGPARFVYDGEGNKTYYRVDTFNRPWITYYPKADGTNFNADDREINYYDNFGRLYRTRQRDGQHIYRSFDDSGRTTLINAPGSADDTSFTYDIAGNILSVSKPGQTLNYTYDNFSRRLSETSDQGTVSYQYDSYGRRSRMNYPGAGNFYVTYDYNNGGQITAIKEKGTSVLASYAYDNLGRRSALTRNGQNVTSYTYDTVSRLTSMTNDLSGTSADQTVSFDYSPSGQIATQTNSNTIYDPTVTNYDVDYVLNGLNQISTANGQLFTYDTAGNLKTAQGKTYDYDYANRLTSVSGMGTLTYDPISRLKTVTGNGATTTFLYDGQDMIAEYEGNTIKKRYVHGPGIDEPLAEYTGTGINDKIWLVSDVRGSITGHTIDGTSVVINSYDEYGKPGDNNSGRFQYTGQIWLEEVELYYYKARFYDPTIRRFLTTDPIGYGDGMNMYAYVGGDSINSSDPSGLYASFCASWTTYSTTSTTIYGGSIGDGRGPSVTSTPTNHSYCHGRGSPGSNDYDSPFSETYVAQVGGGSTIPGGGSKGGCTDVQKLASKKLRKLNPGSMALNREAANAIFSVGGGPLQVAPINHMGPVCPSSGGCLGPDVSATTAQIPNGATIHAYYHTHGAASTTALSPHDVMIGEPSSIYNPFHSNTPGAVQRFDASKFEGNFFIDASGAVRQYVPGTIPGGVSSKTTAAAAAKEIKC